MTDLKGHPQAYRPGPRQKSPPGLFLPCHCRVRYTREVAASNSSGKVCALTNSASLAGTEAGPTRNILN